MIVFFAYGHDIGSGDSVHQRVKSDDTSCLQVEQGALHVLATHGRWQGVRHPRRWRSHHTSCEEENAQTTTEEMLQHVALFQAGGPKQYDVPMSSACLAQ